MDRLDRQAGRQAGRQADREIDKTDRKIDRQTDRQADRQTERERERDRQTDRQTDRQADRQTGRSIDSYTHGESSFCAEESVGNVWSFCHSLAQSCSKTRASQIQWSLHKTEVHTIWGFGTCVSGLLLGFEVGVGLRRSRTPWPLCLHLSLDSLLLWVMCHCGRKLAALRSTGLGQLGVWSWHDLVSSSQASSFFHFFWLLLFAAKRSYCI